MPQHRPTRSVSARFPILGSAVLVAGAVAVLISGCSGESHTVSHSTIAATPADSGTVQSPAAASPASGASPDGTTVGSSGAGGSGADGAKTDPAKTDSTALAKGSGSKDPASDMLTVAAGQSLAFMTPSGNVHCLLSDTLARCEIRQKTWKVTKPSSCDTDYGFGAEVTLKDPASLLCAGDTIMTGSAVVLGYGRGAVAGDLECTVDEKAVTCWSAATKHLFSLSRDAHLEQ